MESHQLDTSQDRGAFSPANAASSDSYSPSASAAAAAAVILKRLRDQLARQIAKLPLGETSAAQSALVSVTLELPEAPTAIPQLKEPQFQFLRAADHEWRAGYGIAAEWHATGPARLRDLATVAEAWSTNWLHADPDQTNFSAFAMLGFAAASEPAPQIEDHLPNALLWVPEIGLRRQQNRTALIFTSRRAQSKTDALSRWNSLLEELIPALVSPSPPSTGVIQVEPDFAEPGQHDWDSLVARALAGIDAGEVEKVVLSRRLDVKGSRRFAIDRLLDVLTRVFPSCEVIHLRRHKSHFVAATPERLLHLQDRNLVVDAIAGTAGRSDCETRDLALGEWLRQSQKNLNEHQFVIDAITDALAPCCQSIRMPSAPELMQLHNAQHLWSPIRAQVNPGTNLFDLAERLHPTPATNGQPRLAAHQWLREHEPFARGWYTGAAGFLEPGQGGELWVLLRCARICGERAELYAGAGIVAGSDPEAEWEETEAKLAAMLSALQFA